MKAAQYITLADHAINEREMPNEVVVTDFEGIVAAFTEESHLNTCAISIFPAYILCAHLLIIIDLSPGNLASDSDIISFLSWPA